ncbi:MAG TPA: RecX family transcriptional regulator [Anaerolineales bacterium]|nr:RecX family transcriptional regulator [Anaerolineales bacterium]
MVKKITALQPQKRNPNRVNVHLEGEFAFGLARITAAWLTVGQELSQDRIDRLLAEDSAEVAYQRALNFLSYRPRSEKEIVDNLRKHETPEQVIEEIVGRLKENGMVDDVKFARLWLENRSEFRPRGSYALRSELRQKGIPDSIIEAALTEIDEVDLALRAGRTKAAKLKSGDKQVFKQKLYGFLSRRGFNYEIISEVVNVIWQEQVKAGR